MPDLLASLAGVPGFSALAGHPEAWVVGGAVRDALLGREPVDLDVVVEGDAFALARSLGTLTETHERFGTAEVRTSDGGRINVAQARIETYAAPGALPDVHPAGIEEDLQRRDFTVNAIAVRAGDGEVRAIGGGEDDIRARVLRVLHPRSFVDDPTRALRLARYAARLGFTIAPETEQLARATDLATVTGPRVGNEVLLMGAEPDPAAAVAEAARLGLLPAPDVPTAQRAAAFAPDGMTALEATLATCFVERAQLDAWAFPAGVRKRVLAARRDAPDLARRAAAGVRASEVAFAFLDAAPATIALAGALGAEKQARRSLAGSGWRALTITGDDLVAAGVPAGPEVGERLRRAHAALLDGDIEPGRDAELRAALE